MPDRPYRVLFVCVDNSCAGQMAEAWLRHLGGDRFVARSAGTAPRHLDPLATRVMQEIGIDIGAQRGKGIDAVRRERFDLVVTLTDAARGAVPPLPGAHRTMHREFLEPGWIQDEQADEMDDFRRLRDELREFVEELIASRE